MANKKTSNARTRDAEIFSDEYIAVMSICPMSLTLTTEPFGKGRSYNFAKFGETKRISYADLVRIIENHPTFLEKGFFYILDERVWMKHGLSEIYKGILTKENIEKVLDMSTDALELYKSATDAQKDFINKILIRRVRDEEYVDYGLVSKIEKLSGVKIIEKAREARELMQEEETVE